MLKQRMSLIALGILSASAAMANDQEQSKGFVEDSHLNIAARNAYISRDYKNHKQDKAEWGQGFIGKFESGFTQGTVGVGVDVIGQYAIRLDGGRAALARVVSTSSRPAQAPRARMAPLATAKRPTIWPRAAQPSNSVFPTLC